VGRILGPRGNSLKRVEATTGCRVLIRGRGSIKDTAKVSLIQTPSPCDWLHYYQYIGDACGIRRKTSDLDFFGFVSSLFSRVGSPFFCFFLFFPLFAYILSDLIEIPATL
jgi:hypothetical protein